MSNLMRAFTILLLSGAALPAAAQDTAPVCGPHDALVGALGRRFEEKPAFVGLTSQGHMMEVFTSARSGSWTIMLTSPQGISCLMADGESWQPAKPEVVPEPGA